MQRNYDRIRQIHRNRIIKSHDEVLDDYADMTGHSRSEINQVVLERGSDLFSDSHATDLMITIMNIYLNQLAVFLQNHGENVTYEQLINGYEPRIQFSVIEHIWSPHVDDISYSFKII